MQRLTKRVFLVGCPRSGTTWLQIILGNHADVATVRETHLFDQYMRLLAERWHAERFSTSRDGLRVLLDDTDFVLACRSFTDIVLAKIAARNPDAKILLEKTATHFRNHRLIRSIYPDAKFLHMVRDPRAVAASLFALGGEEWGAGIPRDAGAAAKLWRESTRIGQDEMSAYGADYLEIRYEDLHTAPDDALQAVWRWLGIETMPYDAERFSIGHLKAHQTEGSPLDPSWDSRNHFFRRGDAESWRDELTADEIATIELLCADLMQDFGYQPMT